MAQASKFSQLLSDQQQMATAIMQPPKLQDYVSTETSSELVTATWSAKFMSYNRQFGREVILTEGDPAKLKAMYGDDWKQDATKVYDDLRTAIGNNHYHISSVKLGNLGHIGLSIEPVTDEQINSLAADWKELVSSVSSSTSHSDVMSSFIHLLEEIASSDQPMVQKFYAMHHKFIQLNAGDPVACARIEWPACVSVIVRLMRQPNNGIRPGDWTKTATALLGTRETLTFKELATVVGKRSAELNEVISSSAASSGASAPLQVLHAGAAPGFKPKKCTLCSKVGHLVGDCIKNKSSPNYGKTLQEVKSGKTQFKRKGKDKGKGKDSAQKSGYNQRERLTFGAIHRTSGPVNPTVLSVNAKEVVAIDTQANISLVNDVRAFKPGTYREFDDQDRQRNSIMGFNGAGHARGMGTAVILLYSDSGVPIELEARNAYFKPEFSHTLLSAVSLLEGNVELERNATGLVLPKGTRIPLLRDDGLLFARGKFKHYKTRSPSRHMPQ